MMPQENISIIVLAYNDAPALRQLLQDLHAELARIAAGFEIVVVDDGSSDDTAHVVTGCAAQLGSIRLVRHETNKGVGAGFRTGVRESRFNIIGYMDGDGQYEPRDLSVFLAALPPGGAAIGVRYERADSLKRRLVSRVYGILVRQIYAVPYQDINCGLKLFRRSYLETVLPLESSGSFFDCEVLTKAFHRGRTAVELPVCHYPRRHGHAMGNSSQSIRVAVAGLVSGQMAPYRRDAWMARVLVNAMKLLR
jgi:glycosyltransferase involved in cell wall biosynthesis